MIQKALRLFFSPGATISLVPTARTCLVSFTDSENIRHAVEVSATTLYEAAVLAMAEFRRCGFTANAPGPVTRLTVKVQSPATSTRCSALEQVGGAVARERLHDAAEAFELAERQERKIEAEYEAWRLLLEQMKEADAA